MFNWYIKRYWVRFCFSEQLKNYMRSKIKNKNDLLIVFSGSGNSGNIINAINFTKKYGKNLFVFQVEVERHLNLLIML